MKRALLSWAGVCCVGVACLAQPQTWQTIDPTTADFPTLLEQLVEEHQTPAGSDSAAANAYPLMLDAIQRAREAVAKHGTSEFPIDFDSICLDSWRAPEGATPEQFRAACVETLDELKGAGLYELLDQMAATPRAVRAKPGSPEREAQVRAQMPDAVRDGRLSRDLYPDLGGARLLARICAARMHLAAEAGDEAEFLRAFEHGLAASRVVRHQPLSMDRIVGTSTAVLILNECIANMHGNELADASLQRANAIAQEQTAGVPPLAFCIRGERLWSMDFLRWGFDKDGKLDEEAFVKEFEEPPFALAGITRDGVQYAMVTFFDELLAAIGPDPVTTANRMKESKERVLATKRLENWLASMWCASLYGVAQQDARREYVWIGFGAAVAIERYRRAKGAYPEKLQALVEAGYIDALPMHPASQTPLGYTRNDATDNAGYVLYAFGIDGEDNAGKALIRDDADPSCALFDAACGKGYDYVLFDAR